MELIDELQRIVRDTVRASDPMAIVYATVIAAEPLKLSITATKLEVSDPVAVLTENVRFKDAYIDGQQIVINPGLTPGDRVLCLKANAGQNYVVLSKV